MTSITTGATLISAALRPDLEGTSAGRKQADEENQRDAWLRQMEMSQIAMLQQGGTHVTGLHGVNIGKPVSQPSFHADRQNPSDASTSPSTDPSPASLLPVHPIVQSRTSDTSDATSPGAAPQSVTSTEAAPQPNAASAMQPAPTSQAPGAAGAPVAAASVAGAPVTSAATQSAAGGSTSATLATAKDTPQAPRPARAMSPAAVAASASASLAASATAIAETATQVEPSPAIAVTRVDTVSAVMPRAGMAGLSLENGEAQESTEAGDSNETAGSDFAKSTDNANSANGGTWQKRLIHVAQDGQELSLSIRDATLDARQSSQIVARVASDAAQSGLRVRSATVNGKTMIRQARNGAGGGEARAFSDSGDIESIISSLDQQEQ